MTNDEAKKLAEAIYNETKTTYNIMKLLPEGAKCEEVDFIISLLRKEVFKVKRAISILREE